MSEPSLSDRGSTSLFARRPQRDPATRSAASRQLRGRPDWCAPHALLPVSASLAPSIGIRTFMASARSTPVGRTVPSDFWYA
jgi:hypothetical protein